LGPLLFERGGLIFKELLHLVGTGLQDGFDFCLLVGGELQLFGQTGKLVIGAHHARSLGKRRH
jgi:hypothetical protein